MKDTFGGNLKESGPAFNKFLESEFALKEKGMFHNEQISKGSILYPYPIHWTHFPYPYPYI